MANAMHIETIAKTATGRSGHELVVGYVIVSVVPAVFWTLLAAWGGKMLGFDISATSLFYIGFAIGSFLAIVFSSLVLQRRTKN